MNALDLVHRDICYCQKFIGSHNTWATVCEFNCMTDGCNMENKYPRPGPISRETIDHLYDPYDLISVTVYMAMFNLKWQYVI